MELFENKTVCLLLLRIFYGPMMGGFLTQQLTFVWAATIQGGLSGLAVSRLILFRACFPLPPTSGYSQPKHVRVNSILGFLFWGTKHVRLLQLLHFPTHIYSTNLCLIFSTDHATWDFLSLCKFQEAQVIYLGLVNQT